MAVRRGRGTKIRWAALAAGVVARPADNTLTLITGLQSSEITGTQDLADEPTGDYETTDNNLWRDGDQVERLGWTFSMGGHVTDVAAQATELQELWDAWAAGSNIWIERLRPGDTHWKGGRVILQDPSEPADWDAEQTFSWGGLGQGAIVRTAVV